MFVMYWVNNLSCRRASLTNALITLIYTSTHIQPNYCSHPPTCYICVCGCVCMCLYACIYMYVRETVCVVSVYVCAHVCVSLDHTHRVGCDLYVSVEGEKRG